jgi:CRP-like cAMP-binding protein
MRIVDCDACPIRQRVEVVCSVAGLLDEIAAAGRFRVYRRREIIFDEGDPANGLHLVCHGAVKLFSASRAGCETVLDVAGRGRLIGALSLRDDDLLPVSAGALTKTQICFLSPEGVERLVRKTSQAALRLLGSWSREVARARWKVRGLILKAAEARLATLLLELGRDGAREAAGKSQLDHDYSRRELADMVGVAPETVIRLLAKLRRRGIVRLSGRRVFVLDREALARVADREIPSKSRTRRPVPGGPMLAANQESSGPGSLVLSCADGGIHF